MFCLRMFQQPARLRAGALDEGTHAIFASAFMSAAVPSIPPASMVLLILVALVGGIGITVIGPGGVLVAIGLFAFTDLSPAEVAETAIVTHS